MERYDSYIDSGIEVLGKVPSSWKKSKFKFQHFEQDERVGEDSTEYDLLSLTKKGIILRDIESGKGKFPESFDTYKKVKKDDLIFCLYDIEETPRTVGLSELKGMITGSYKIFNSKDVIPKFTYYTFLVIDDVKGLKPYYTGLRNVVRPETFKSLPFFFPPLSEQQQIVSFLDTKTSLIDSLIEKTQRKIELLKEKRTSLINEVVTKGLNPNVEMKDSGVEWIGKIPSGWEKSKLKHKGVFFSGYSFDSKDFLSEGEIRVLKISNIQNNGISWDDLQYLPESFYDTHQNFIVNKGDLVFVLTRPIISTGIKVCFFNEEYKTLLNQRNSVFRPNESSVIKRFLFYSVRTFSFIEEFKQQLKETNQPNISTEQISNILMFFPPLSEQNEIVSYLDEQTQLIDKTISIEEKRIELLKEYRQSLISEVVTGKRKVVE